MSPAAALAIGSVCALGLTSAAAAGWLAPGRPPEAALTVIRHAPRLAPEGPAGGPESDAASVAELAGVLPTFGALAAPTAKSREVVVYRRPPQARIVQALTAANLTHDAGVTFRAEAAAVLRLQDHSLAVLLAAKDDRASRILRVGDAYDEHWRLISLTMDQAVLSDGSKQERVPLFGGVPGAAAGEP